MFRFNLGLGLLFGLTSLPMAFSHEIVSHFGHLSIYTGFVVPATYAFPGTLLADIDGNEGGG